MSKQNFTIEPGKLKDAIVYGISTYNENPNAAQIEKFDEDSLFYFFQMGIEISKFCEYTHMSDLMEVLMNLLRTHYFNIRYDDVEFVSDADSNKEHTEVKLDIKASDNIFYPVQFIILFLSNIERIYLQFKHTTKEGSSGII